MSEITDEMRDAVYCAAPSAGLTNGQIVAILSAVAPLIGAQERETCWMAAMAAMSCETNASRRMVSAAIREREERTAR